MQFVWQLQYCILSLMEDGRSYYDKGFRGKQEVLHGIGGNKCCLHGSCLEKSIGDRGTDSRLRRMGAG